MSLYLGQTRLSANRGSYGVLKKNLANIDTEGIDYLLNSKSILSGDIGSNSSVYNNILNYKHSTFDLKKFTVVGSPTISDDGIITNTSNLNCVLVNNIDLRTANTWEIDLLINIQDINLSENICLVFNTDNRLVSQITPNLHVDWFVNVGTKNINLFSNENIIQQGVNKVKLKYDSSSGYNIFVNDVQVASDTTTSKTTANGSFYIGSGYSTLTMNEPNSIDLKSFAIWADGIPVFNGNKTGIDVIKQDDYKVIGSPVITEDGIASGFLSGVGTANNVHYIQTQVQLSQLKGHSWEIHGRWINWNVTTPNSSNAFFDFGGWVAFSSITYMTLSRQLICWKRTGTSEDTDNQGRYATLTLENNPDYIDYIYGFNINTGEYYTKVEYGEGWKDVATYIPETENKELYNINVYPNYYVRIGTGSDTTYNKNATDLNCFKIYIDGNLVYQPCLKIPYTESKTGSKIVDSVYRQRISDLYELQGYAPYYSLDEQNQTYTLPKGEVYGMINKYGNEYTKSHITNTIFNTSNNINLVNSNGNLVLKAGSIFYFPNGFEEDGVTRKFITKTIPSDKTIIYEGTNRKNLVICLTASLTTALTYDYECYSSTDGTTPPSSVNRRVWYDMQNNVIKTYSPNSDTAETELISFPIALVDTLDTVNKFSISKVFNSVGYIDKCLFTLPGIQLLCPNGIKDNSLNNNIITIKDIIVNNREDNLTGTYNLRISPREIIATAVQYDYHNNVNSLDDELYKDSTIIGTVEYASGRIINLNYSDTLSLVHYGNFSDALSKSICTTSPISSTGNYTCTSYKPAVVVYNYVNGKSWYRLYSDGWCEQGGETEVFQSNTQKTISLLKQLIADNYQVNLIQIMSTDSPTCSTVNFITQRNSDSFTINYTTWGSDYPQIKYLWEAKGYIQ